MELRTLTHADTEQMWQLERDAFHVPDERREGFLRHFDPGRAVGAFDGRRLVALTLAHPFGQYFGGRSVPMGGVASVAVAPDWRGRGLARQAIASVLDAMRARGELISSLFPATTGLYRGLGWELGGCHVWRKLAPHALPSPDAGRVRPGGASDLGAVHDCYARMARGIDRCLDRPDTRWRALEDARRERSLYLAEDADGGVEGYLIYRQLDGDYSSLNGPFRLAVDEWVWTTRDAGLALGRLLGSWASQVTEIYWRGPAEDPLLLLLPEPQLETLAEVRWMTRLVDAAGAVEARGFRPGVEVEVDLELSDPLLEHHRGRFVLRVRKGRGRLDSGGAGRVALGIEAFSSLYTGWAASATLARTGRLRGGSEEDRAALDAAFGGPTPWMLDEF